MANPNWIAAAAVVRQVQTYTFGGTWEATDIIRATIGAATLDFIAGSTAPSTVVSNLVAAWTALSNAIYPQFRKLTPSANSTDFILTGPTDGEPFTVTLTPLETGGGAADAQTIEGAGTATTGTATTVPQSPNHWSVAANWSTGAVPVSTDTVTAEGSGIPIKWGLAQSAVTLTSLTVRNNLSGFYIGLPKTNPDGYAEYLPDYLHIGATTIEIEDTQAARIKIQQAAGSTTVRVLNSGTGADTGVGAVLLKGTLTTLEAQAGAVDVARYAGETATVTTLRNSGATLYVGSGTGTITTGTLSGGTTTSHAAFTTLVNSEGSTCELRGTASSATVNSEGTLYVLDTHGIGTALNVNEGVTYHRSSTTVALLRVNSGGKFQRDKDGRTLTVTTAVVTAGAAISDKQRTITWTNDIKLDRCALHDVQLELGSDVTIGVTPN